MFQPPQSGSGSSGQLGHGNHDNRSTLSKVEGFDGKSISGVACGDMHTVALTSEGSLYSFGSNEQGQNGLGHSNGIQAIPTKVRGWLELRKVVFVTANGFHSACINEDGDTYTWGSGEFGKLGHGDCSNCLAPKRVQYLVGKKAKGIACGSGHTVVIAENGLLYSFGHGAFGQLGHCNFQDRLFPSVVEGPLVGKCVLQVACGRTHSMALTSEGRLYTWGHAEYGKLGHGSEIQYSIPYIVESLIGYKVVAIASSSEHSVALVDDSKRLYTKKMRSMIDDETCTDIVFVLKNNERIHANKGLLIGRSEYFRAMFRSNLKESRRNEVQVGDCSKRVFLLLLEYLYLGEVDIGEVMEDAKDLYLLSHRYQEDGLSRQCLEVIEKGFIDKNVIELLAEADNLGLVALKDICMEYVVSKRGILIERERVANLSHSLLVELLCNITKHHS